MTLNIRTTATCLCPESLIECLPGTLEMFINERLPIITISIHGALLTVALKTVSLEDMI